MTGRQVKEVTKQAWHTAGLHSNSVRLPLLLAGALATGLKKKKLAQVAEVTEWLQRGKIRLGTLFLPNSLKLGAVAGSYLGEKFGDLLQGGCHFGKMPVRCTAKTVLSRLSRACGGPLRLKRMVAARDVEGIVACLHQVAHNRPPKSISTVGMATWMIE